MFRRQVTVRKLDHRGREVTTYPGCLLHRDPHAIVLGTRWRRSTTDLGYVVLEPADRWLEVFYIDRWYNVFEIYAADGQLKGWYCNVTRPARLEGDQVLWEDLALDVWIEPGQSPRILDREEFAALDLEPAERAAARAAMDRLLERSRRHGRPFDGKEETWMRRWRSEWDSACGSAD